MNIDAKKLILGRIATLAAKKALQGEQVNIFNSEQVVVTGGRHTLDKYAARLKRGPDPTHGPFFPRTPVGIMRRTIRGMLPYKQARGMEAFRRVRCYIGIPDKFKDVKFESVEKASIKKLPKYDFLSLNKLCKELGWKK